MKRLAVVVMVVALMAAVGCLRETANTNSGAVSMRLTSGSTDTVSSTRGQLGGSSVAFNGLAEDADVSISIGTHTDIADFILAGPVAQFSATNLQGGQASFFAANISVPYDALAVGEAGVWLYTQIGNGTPFRVESAVANAGLLTVTVTSFAASSRFWALTPAGAPVVTTITPGLSLIQGGTTMTIKGNSFMTTEPTTVMIGNVAATNVMVLDQNTITCTIPAGESAGAPDITVTTGRGSATVQGAFSYIVSAHNPG